jgi:sugar lactone lactonase YvrE
MAITSGRSYWRRCSIVVLCAVATPAIAETPLFQSRAITPPGEYTFGIEGPAVDAAGDLYVVNFGKPGSIGRLPAGAAQSEKFIDLPDGSVGVSIRFARDGAMYIADYKKHTIFIVERGAREPMVWFHSDVMSQPNDITIARDGAIYASDPDWKGRSGRIWRIAKAADGSIQGEAMTAPRAMGTTNGIDLSPDGNTLYVGESGSGQIWSYAIAGNTLTKPRLLATFEPNTIDGLRTDVAGRIVVARILKGEIAVIAPNGKLVRSIALTGKEPTNLAFGGSDGKTVYVTQRAGGYIESFRSDREGREHCMIAGTC